MQLGIFYAASRYTNKSGLIHSGSVMGIAINMVSCISFYALVQATGLSLLYMHGSTHEITTCHSIITFDNLDCFMIIGLCNDITSFQD